MRIIKKIHIQGFRSIFELKSEDLKDINIFFGGNDAGKSNVLKALNLFFNGETSFGEDFNFQKDYSKARLKYVREQSKGKQCIKIRIYFNHEILLKGQKQGLKTIINKNNGDFWVERIWWGYDPRDYEQKLPKYFDKASQGIKRSLTVLLESIKYIYVPAFKDVSVFSTILGKLGQEELSGFNFPEIDSLNEALSSATNELSTDFENTTKIKTTINLPTTLKAFWASISVSSSLYGGTPDASYLIDFIQRGEGIKSIYIPILLNWISKNTLNRHWIWGVDEPENSLEADKIQTLFNSFLEYGFQNQIFLSTHSPVFCFPSQKAYSIKDNDGEILESPIEVQVMLADHTSPGDTQFIIFDDIEKNKSELEKQFGVSYVQFLEVQKEMAEKYEELDNVKNENDKLKLEINASIDSNLPILFVEGPSDKALLEAAWMKLRPALVMPFLIQSAFDRSFLGNTFAREEIFINYSSRLFIGLLDFDDAYKENYKKVSEKEEKIGGVKQKVYIEIEEDATKCLVLKNIRNNGYLMMLPIPEFRSEYAGKDQLVNQLSIELLFQDRVIESYCKDKKITSTLIFKKFNDSKKIPFSNSSTHLSAEEFAEFDKILIKIEEIISTHTYIQ